MDATCETSKVLRPHQSVLVDNKFVGFWLDLKNRVNCTYLQFKHLKLKVIMNYCQVRSQPTQVIFKEGRTNIEDYPM